MQGNGIITLGSNALNSTDSLFRVVAPHNASWLATVAWPSVLAWPARGSGPCTKALKCQADIGAKSQQCVMTSKVLACVASRNAQQTAAQSV